MTETEQVTLNEEQRLFVIPHEKGYTCLGFDVCEERSGKLAAWIQGKRSDYDLPPETTKGTLDAYARYQELLDYARLRLGKCPYQEGKPTCANCPIHCYRPEMREKIRATMRYAGPRMLLRHPILAILHLLDGRKEAPDLRHKLGVPEQP